MKPSAIGWFFREINSRGIRVRGGHMDMEIPEGANLVCWETVRYWHDTDGTYHEELTGEKKPVAWWVFEHKVGEETKQVKRTVKGEKKLVDVVVELFQPGYKEQAGNLVELMEAPESQWVLDLGVTGELRNNNPGGFMAGIDRREWLECEVCHESCCTYKKFGPATASKKCDFTPRCEGKIRRLPLRFEVTSPRTIPKRKPKEEKETVLITPGAERFKKRRTTKTKTKTVVEEWVEDVESEEETADITVD